MAKHKKSVDPRVTETLVKFGADLEAVYKLAGKPVTLRWLEQKSRDTRGVPLPPTSVWRIFKGESPEPDWPMIQQVLTLCGVPEQEITEKWQPRWKALRAHIHALGVANILSPLASRGCPTCGVAVLNENLHRTYHADQEAQRRRATIRSIGIDTPAEPPSLAG